MDEARVFSAVNSNRARGSGHKLEHRKLHTDMRKNVYFEGIWTLEQAAKREVLESCSLEIFRTQLNAFLCCLL